MSRQPILRPLSHDHGFFEILQKMLYRYHNSLFNTINIVVVLFLLIALQ